MAFQGHHHAYVSNCLDERMTMVSLLFRYLSFFESFFSVSVHFIGTVHFTFARFVCTAIYVHIIHATAIHLCSAEHFWQPSENLIILLSSSIASYYALFNWDIFHNKTRKALYPGLLITISAAIWTVCPIVYTYVTVLPPVFPSPLLDLQDDILCR